MNHSRSVHREDLEREQSARDEVVEQTILGVHRWMQSQPGPVFAIAAEKFRETFIVQQEKANG